MAASRDSQRASTSTRQRTSLRREGTDEAAQAGRIAHTLTACCRCRQRKTKCDPSLPRCSACERSNSVCEYYDPARGTNINRNYVIWLQHRARALEEQLEHTERDEDYNDPEAMMRGAAAVRIQEGDDTKFLGPSSGIAITRLVMQLAKEFTESKSIKELVPDAKQKHIKDTFAQEEGKPTSKTYALTSNVAAPDLPQRGLIDMLLRLYNLKVQTMYPILHEPTFAQDLEDVYNGSQDPYQNFMLRMVIAVSMQKLDTQYAGLADSYYLAALSFLEKIVVQKDLKTLQCFAIIAEYSLLTPTRTAIYFVVGLAVRLTQSLGLNEEKTVVLGRGGALADFLEIDMRRRLFWSILVMELGLSHSLGRPSTLATGLDHLDVQWFDTAADEDITPQGVRHGAPKVTLKKWIAIHFFKMRLLQLEIRRKLYQKKRPEPKDDQDPWFKQMEAKLHAWKDASPNNDEGIDVDVMWPSPQVPRPSTAAAIKCYDACQKNIVLQRAQMEKNGVDITWIFTQAIFMAINSMLWSLSYSEIRRLHLREEVEGNLRIAMEAIRLASDRWPGVLSAIELYNNLIDALMKIYDKDGDIPISTNSPSDMTDTTSPASTFPDAPNHSRTTSPAATANGSVASRPERPPPFGYISASGESVPTVADPYPATSSSPANAPQTIYQTMSSAPLQTQAMNTEQQHLNIDEYTERIDFDPTSHFNALPTGFSGSMSWNPAFIASQPGFYGFAVPGSDPIYDPPRTNDFFSVNSTNNIGILLTTPTDQYANSIYQPYWYPEGQHGSGLNQTQQEELMQMMETDGMQDIDQMIQDTSAMLYRGTRPY
ncbi:hypothetical protein LTR16_000265 [Cryomyces antarcticus]|uniref:Zn(2)-C6 fungal-type domain-containing protein n=1 Tax=Cryomyces antarcticus TaxID=329879 RepID=A0ABR0LR28_9PEZI|nr:hypothetical protein LTR39_000157 [Cryomyces antarcticus]KAK5021264.1 hypothetical protein LTR60_000062 [Cryomyces antarcticus]KAK5202132.1 hypothetical protein LTR16_000265 [Cryomyces antarcticus]